QPDAATPRSHPRRRGRITSKAAMGGTGVSVMRSIGSAGGDEQRLTHRPQVSILVVEVPVSHTAAVGGDDRARSDIDPLGAGLPAEGQGHGRWNERPLLLG